jgi:predicted Zn-dependent protease
MSHFFLLHSPTRLRFARAIALIFSLLACLAWFANQSARAQSMLRDAETETFLHEASRPIFVAAGLNPDAIEFYLLGDTSINAFVAGGQNIFINAGLILNADNVDQLLGVIAHETGHISGGHLARMGDGFKGATAITLLSMLLGAAAIAAGSGDAGQAILMGGQTAATASFLAYSRTQESAADQAGALFLEKSGMSGRGFLEFFEILARQLQRMGIKQENGYWQTHPLTDDRIQRLEEKVKASPHWNTPPDPVLNRRFLRIKAKLAGFMYEPARTLQMYPETDQSEFGHLARAYAYSRDGQPDLVRREVEALVAKDSKDPYFLELKGQLLLESGYVAEAIPPLRQAVALAPTQPLIMGTLGHALLATDSDADLPEARRILENSVRLDQQNPFAWYQLGVVYGRQGDMPRAALANAERLLMVGNPMETIRSAKMAEAAFPEGSRERLRAQDILLVAQEQAKRLKERRR